MNRRELYERLTSQIISDLKKGIIPWRKTWKVELPANYLTKKPYQGINFLNLLRCEYPTPYYLTYLQCKERGGYVKKGESGHLIIYWSIKEIEEGDEVCEVPIVRYSYVFNLAQTSLYKGEREEMELRSCREIVDRMPNPPEIRYNTSRCYYNPAEDVVSMVPRENFINVEEYYSALYHELIHSTAHASRLNRGFKEDYAYEELIAEIGSVYLSGLSGIMPRTLKNQVSYIGTWLKMIEGNPKVLLRAAAEAQKAVNYITQTKSKEEEPCKQ
jgi:antirestriction protein ArdC